MTWPALAWAVRALYLRGKGLGLEITSEVGWSQSWGRVWKLLSNDKVQRSGTAELKQGFYGLMQAALKELLGLWSGCWCL